MYWIKRCYFDGVGHPESFYRNQTFDFFPEKWQITSNKVPHTYIDLVNGGGKTTWISLLLTLFEPQKNRFVQCVAGRKKGKKYHYNDYFHRQLSTIVVEMVDDKQRSVLLGQYHQKQGDQTEVEHFICEGPDLYESSIFELIPSVGRSRNNPRLKEHTDSIKTARNWLRSQKNKYPGYWRYYGKRNEWHDGLREIGVNLQMIDTLITINSEEGGVSHFAKYRSESDFLQKFFACCFPSRDIDSLANTCAQDVQQGNELRELQERDIFYQELNRSWNQFRPRAQEAITHLNNLKHVELDLAELLRDLYAFRQHIDQKISSYSNNISDLESSLERSRKERKLKNDQLCEATYQISLQEFEAAKTREAKTQEELADNENARLILEAVSDYKAWQHQDNLYAQQNATLDALRLNKEEPLTQILADARGRARFVFEREIRTQYERGLTMDGTIRSLTENRSKKETALQKISETIIRSETTLEQCKYNIAAADAELEDLKTQQLIHTGESPEIAHKRLAEETEKTKRGLVAAHEILNTSSALRKVAKQEYKNSEDRLCVINSTLSRCQEQINQANRSQEQIQGELRSVNVTSNTKDGHFIDELLSRLEIDLEQKHSSESEENHSIRRQLNDLKNSGHLLVDAITRKALDLFYGQGLSREQIWAYPEYLSGILEDDEHKAASIIDSNPGRYLGLAVSDDIVLQKVKGILNNIPWSDRPIPISGISEADLNPDPESTVVVLAASDKVLYSKKAWKQRIVSLERELKDSDERLSGLNHDLKKIQSVHTQWHRYWREIGSQWSQLWQQFKHTEQEKASITQVKKLSEQALEQAEEQWTEANQRLTECTLLEKYAENHYQQICYFLTGKWQAKIDAELELTRLSEENQENQREKSNLQSEIDSIQQQLDMFNRERGELDNIYKTLSSSFNNSSFNNVEPITVGTEGVSVDVANKKVLLAEEELKQFQQSPEMTQVMKELKEIESKRKKFYNQLSAKNGWSNSQDQVIEKSQMEQGGIEQELSNKIRDIENIKEQLRTDKTYREKMHNDLLSAQNDRPWNIELPENMLELRKLKIDLKVSIKSLDQQIGRDYEQLTFYRNENHKQQKELSRCNDLVSSILSCTLEPADGSAKQISDISQVQTIVKASKDQFDNQKTLHEKAEKYAKEFWRSFIGIVHTEARKPYEIQRDSIMVQKLQGINYEDSLGALENTTLGLQDCFDANRDSIEKIQRSWNSTIILLETHLRKAIRILQETIKVRIPHNSPIHPGKTIFKMSDQVSKLATIDLSTICKMSLEQWIKDGEIPVNSGTHDKLTTFLVQKLLPEQELDVRLIKTSRTERASYFPISEPTGSDGQLLTTAFLLYMTITKVRTFDSGEQGYGFMVADNPIGECNADDLVRIQLHMASAIGVQLIYLTGHADLNAQAMFDKNIFMGRVERLHDIKLIGRLKDDEDKDPLWNAALTTPSLLRHENT